MDKLLLLPRRCAGVLPLGCLCLVLFLALSGCGGHKRSRAQSTFSAADRTMLEQYEAIRGLLAQDDFRGVKRRAETFRKANETAEPPPSPSPATEALTQIATATSLPSVRDAFRDWSKHVIELTRDVQGFYVVRSPLEDRDEWLQTSDKVENPYMGKSMRDRGEVEK